MKINWTRESRTSMTATVKGRHFAATADTYGYHRKRIAGWHVVEEDADSFQLAVVARDLRMQDVDAAVADYLERNPA